MISFGNLAVRMKPQRTKKASILTSNIKLSYRNTQKHTQRSGEVRFGLALSPIGIGNNPLALKKLNVIKEFNLSK